MIIQRGDLAPVSIETKNSKSLLCDAIIFRFKVPQIVMNIYETIYLR